MSPNVFERKLRQIEQRFAIQLLFHGIAEFAAKSPQLCDLDLPGDKYKIERHKTS